MSSRKISASELMARLEADPQFVDRRRAQEEERKKRVEEWRAAEAPLVVELRAAGYDVESVWTLVNTPGSYPQAVQILLAHLALPYPAVVREGIARALAVPEARVGWRLLTSQYRAEQDGRVKDGLAVAIAGAADETVIGDVIELVRDVSHGPSRLLLLRALQRSGSPGAREALLGLRNDPELRKEIKAILRPDTRRRRREGP